MKTWIDDHGFERRVNDVFMSYGRRTDASRIRVIVERLENEDLSVFGDWDIPPGVLYIDFIHKALNNSRLVLVVWSDESITSDWVYSEAEFARVRKRLVSCRIDECTPNPPFNTFETADLSGSRWVNSESWKQLVDLIKYRVTNASAASPMADIAMHSKDFGHFIS